jgi:hypothetical protein
MSNDCRPSTDAGSIWTIDERRNCSPRLERCDPARLNRRFPSLPHRTGNFRCVDMNDPIARDRIEARTASEK